MKTLEQIKRKFKKVDKNFEYYNNPENWENLSPEQEEHMRKQLDMWSAYWDILNWVLH